MKCKVLFVKNINALCLDGFLNTLLLLLNADRETQFPSSRMIIGGPSVHGECLGLT